VTIANVEMAAAWDGAEGEHWAAQADRYEATGTRYGEALLRAAAVRPRDAILDIGCGTGSMTLALARMAPSGSVLGIDLSSKMLAHARSVAEKEGLTNVSFEQADAQVHPFPEHTFDVAVSEFGAMFFADPVAAFANIRRSLVPGGRLVLSAWREFAANEWISSLRDALAVGRTFPMPGAGSPGPFGLADRDQTDGILAAAGFEDISIEKVEEPILLGADADDAYSFVSTFGMTRGLTHDLDDAGRAAALESLHASLRAHETSAGVLFGGSAWLVRASRPE
jgi:SAM-dependent methyltransferase